MTRILIVRHGQTNYNLLGRYQGQLDTPLNDMGIKQANDFKERILKSNIHIDEIWSSDLQRTRATVSPIAEALCLPMHLHAGLREVHVGKFTDKSQSFVKETYPKELENVARYGIYPDGETNMDVRKRAYKTVCEIAKKNDGKTILVASHGGTIHRLIAEIFSILGMSCPQIEIPNCAIFTFEYDNDTLALISMETAEGEEIHFTKTKDKKDIAVL